MANRSTIDPKLMKLFTAAERSLLSASRGADLERATHSELGRLLARARTLRDKWWDRFRSQRRSTIDSHRGRTDLRSRTEAGNDRSREKAELFADAVGRFEARIAALGAKVAAAVTAGRRSASNVKLGKTARAAAHRGARAQTRQALASLVTAKPGRRVVSPAGKLAPVAAPAGPRAAAQPKGKPSTGGVATERVTTVKAAGKRSKKRHVGRPPSVVEAITTKHKKKKSLGVDPLRQLSVQSKLKATRFKISGRDTQTRGHMAAQTRRAQGRRDSRGR